MFADMEDEEEQEEDLIANWKQQIALNNGQQEGANGQYNPEGSERERNDADSFGTGSFTTNTFNARLAGSHGM